MTHQSVFQIDQYFGSCMAVSCVHEKSRNVCYIRMYCLLGSDSYIETYDILVETKFPKKKTLELLHILLQHVTKVQFLKLLLSLMTALKSTVFEKHFHWVLHKAGFQERDGIRSPFLSKHKSCEMSNNL